MMNPFLDRFLQCIAMARFVIISCLPSTDNTQSIGALWQRIEKLEMQASSNYRWRQAGSLGSCRLQRLICEEPHWLALNRDQVCENKPFWKKVSLADRGCSSAFSFERPRSRVASSADQVAIPKEHSMPQFSLQSENEQQTKIFLLCFTSLDRKIES